MSSYTLEQLEDIPVVILRFHRDFNFEQDFETALRESDALIDQIAEPIYYVCDTTELPMPTLKGIIESTNFMARRPRAKELRDLMKEVLLISPQKLFQMVAKGLNSEAFGWVNVKIFESYTAALEYLSTKLAGQESAD